MCAGGAGQLYQHSTNPPGATGDGMAMAYFAGAEMADMEFVQFHPTALNLPDAPRFLLSEAMRGEGAVLRNAHGKRFMADYDERLELAPRDIVSRSIVAEMRKTGTRTVFLDITDKSEEFLKERFPKIYETCKYFGLNIATDQLPVSPASHYCMGGIRTDLWGRSSIEGLYAAGEVTCTGVHGANRLASNSLLEGLVFGARAGAAVLDDTKDFSLSEKAFVAVEEPSKRKASRSQVQINAVSKRVKRVMWERVGILRDSESLTRALSEFEQISKARLAKSSENFLALAQLVAKAALWREESRGGHYRTDFPETLDDWSFHSIQRIDTEIASRESLADTRS
jgi:L-aspartate oxidase